MSDLAVSADPVELANRLRPMLLRVNRELRREGASLGISGGQATLLHLISTSPGAGVRELATREGMSAAGMSGHVDRLEAAGLVRRVPSTADRRRVGLELTDEGNRMLRAVRRRRTAWLATRLDRLTPAELDALEAALVPLGRLLEADA
jgi:DNA-binding MarR family transcriptional regulator